MDSLTDKLSRDIESQTHQVQRMLVCKGAMEVAEAQAVCTDIECLRGLLQDLQQKVFRCADRHIQRVFASNSKF